MLQECGEIAALRLSGALSDGLKQASDRLFHEATRVDDSSDREPLLDAAEFARVRRHAIVSDFIRHFEQDYEGACHRKRGFLSATEIDFDPSQLKIVEHDLLEDALDPGIIAEPIQNACWETLYDLAKWYGILLDVPDLNPNDIPLGPRFFAMAVSDAMREQPWRHEAKRLLHRVLCRYLPNPVGLLYWDLIDHFNAGDLERTPGNEAPAEADGLPDPGTGYDFAEAVPGTTVDVSADLSDRERATGLAGTPPQAAEVTAGARTGDGPTAALPDIAAEAKTVAAAGLPAPAADSKLTSSARTAARRAVARCMARTPMPDFVSEFLTDQWQVLLARIHLEAGGGSRAWADAVGIMDDLAWSLTPKTTREDYMRLVEGMPGLLKRLDSGMDILGCPLEVRNRFSFRLAECHAAVMASSLPRDATAQAGPSLSKPQREPPVDVAVAPVPPGRRKGPARSRAPVGNPGSIPAADIHGSTKAGAPAIPTYAQASPETRRREDPLKHLASGLWMELRESGGTTRELKLAWISPRRSLYLLTNRQGHRALSLGADDMATMLLEGRARIIQIPSETADPAVDLDSQQKYRKTA